MGLPAVGASAACVGYLLLTTATEGQQKSVKGLICDTRNNCILECFGLRGFLPDSGVRFQVI